jgi:hypothetical protein
LRSERPLPKTSRNLVAAVLNNLTMVAMTACIDSDKREEKKRWNVRIWVRGSRALCSSQAGPLSPRFARWLEERKFTLSQDSNIPVTNRSSNGSTRKPQPPRPDLLVYGPIHKPPKTPFHLERVIRGN